MSYNMSCPDISLLEECSDIGYSYIRPGTSNSLIPWIYSLVILLLHLPLVIIRVVRWETGQIWALAMATFSVILTIVAYWATGLDADKVLVWTPIAFVLDVGAVMQIFILIAEEDGERAWQSVICWWESRTYKIQRRPDPLREIALNMRKTSTVIWLLSSSAFLFMALLILQVYDLVSSITGHSVGEISATWCSPTFQLGKVVYDGFNSYPVELLHTGTACINISGDVLPHWLVTTTAFLIIELVAEYFDAFLLIIINASRGWGNFKFKRPWCSMFLGIGVWIFIFGYGIFRTKIYPLQNHQVVIANNISPCWVTLNPADSGVR